MAYFEASKLKDNSGNIINPAQEESLSLLRSIFRLLKPLGMITGSQSNRLSVDVNSGSVTIGSGTVTTVTTVTTCASVTNVANTGGVNTFDLMKAMSRTAYNSGIRSNLT
jgi:hypothetical protein